MFGQMRGPETHFDRQFRAMERWETIEYKVELRNPYVFRVLPLVQASHSYLWYDMLLIRPC